MILKKGNLTVSVTNDIQLAAFLSSGWTEDKVKAKDPEPEEKKKGKGGK